MRNERQRDRFVVSQCQSPLAESRVHGGARGVDYRAAVSGQSICEFVVAMQAGNFFDDVDLALHIQSPTRDLHAKLRVGLPLRYHAKAQVLEDAENLSGIQIPAEDALDFGKPQYYRGLVELSRDHIDGIANQFSSARVQNERSHQIARQNRGFKIYSTLKAVGCVSVN